MFGRGAQQVRRPIPEPGVTSPIFARDTVATMRANLADQLEEILDTVWRQERWAREEERLDHLLRTS